MARQKSAYETQQQKQKLAFERELQKERDRASRPARKTALS